MKITRSVTEPARQGLSWQETWQGPDRGLIHCWQLGRKLAEQSPELAEKCRRGELPVSAWKGGVSRTLKKLTRYGSLNYLAEWQGFRGEALNIDLEQEVTHVCTHTGMIVTFTPDLSKLANQRTDEDDKETADGSSPGMHQQPLLSPSEN